MGDLKTVGDLIFVDHLFFLLCFWLLAFCFLLFAVIVFKLQSLFLCHDRAVGCCISSTQCVRLAILQELQSRQVDIVVFLGRGQTLGMFFACCWFFFVEPHRLREVGSGDFYLS